MTDAPEKIWAWVDYDGNWDGVWLGDSPYPEPHRMPDGEYLRADLVPRWQPIETAEHGQTFIAFCDGFVEMVNSSADGFHVTNHGLKVTPTHWMPLPEPPEGGE